MKDERKRIITAFEKLDDTIQEQVKLVNPEGFIKNLIEFKNKQGELITALRFETDEVIYMIKMTVRKAKQIMHDDIDFNDTGFLKKNIQELNMEKYSDLDYILLEDD